MKRNWQALNEPLLLLFSHSQLDGYGFITYVWIQVLYLAILFQLGNE